LGLEISDNWVRILQLKMRGKEIAVAAIGMAAIPAGVVKAGEVKDEEKLAAAIKVALSRLGKK